MEEKNDFALVPKPSSSLQKAEPGATRILSDMVSDTLALVKKEHSAKPVFWVLMGAGEMGRFFEMYVAWGFSQQYDFRFIKFDDEAGLLRSVQEQPFDLTFVVLNNIRWEGRIDGNTESRLLDAIELLARLKAQYGKPVIVCSPYISDFGSLAERLRKVGVPYLPCPFMPKDVWSALQAALKITFDQKHEK